MSIDIRDETSTSAPTPNLGTRDGSRMRDELAPGAMATRRDAPDVTQHIPHETTRRIARDATRRIARDATQHDADDASHSTARRVLDGARLLLVALWLGGAVFFSFVVAPSAFAVLPARELAGALVTRTIAVVNVGGFVISLLLVATAFGDGGRDATRRARLAEIVSLAVVAIACGVGHWIIAARMLALRAAMGRPIDQVLAGDPVRAAFNSLHGYSVGAMGVAMLAGLVALLAIAHRTKS
jgi:hypothetical protein